MTHRTISIGVQKVSGQAETHVTAKGIDTDFGRRITTVRAQLAFVVLFAKAAASGSQCSVRRVSGGTCAGKGRFQVRAHGAVGTGKAETFINILAEVEIGHVFVPCRTFAAVTILIGRQIDANSAICRRRADFGRFGTFVSGNAVSHPCRSVGRHETDETLAMVGANVVDAVGVVVATGDGQSQAFVPVLAIETGSDVAIFAGAREGTVNIRAIRIGVACVQNWVGTFVNVFAVVRVRSLESRFAAAAVRSRQILAKGVVRTGLNHNAFVYQNVLETTF